MNFLRVAQKEFRNYNIFSDLARVESNPEFRHVLEELAAYEQDHYTFWSSLVDQKTTLAKPRLWFYRWLRKLFGITFIIRFLERDEEEMIEEIRQFLFESKHPDKKAMEDIIFIDEAKEQKLLKRITEERVEFLGSIVLGLNDGLIELSGALTGFTFAFQHSPTTIVLAGFILGISASLSMASSAYLQARHEKGKNPTKSALYTGIAYLVVVLLLILPYLILPGMVFFSLALMISFVVAIVAALSFYTSTVFAQPFRESFTEMLVFSIGTAFVSFLIGTAARAFLGIQV